VSGQDNNRDDQESERRENPDHHAVNTTARNLTKAEHPMKTITITTADDLTEFRVSFDGSTENNYKKEFLAAREKLKELSKKLEEERKNRKDDQRIITYARHELGKDKWNKVLEDSLSGKLKFFPTP